MIDAVGTKNIAHVLSTSNMYMNNANPSNIAYVGWVSIIHACFFVFFHAFTLGNFLFTDKLTNSKTFGKLIRKVID